MLALLIVAMTAGNRLLINSIASVAAIAARLRLRED
jgi:hypothetical protein